MPEWTKTINTIISIIALSWLLLLVYEILIIFLSVVKIKLQIWKMESQYLLNETKQRTTYCINKKKE